MANGTTTTSASVIGYILTEEGWSVAYANSNCTGGIKDMPSVDRSGYDFNGYWSAASGGVQIVAPGSTTIKYTTYTTWYAQWKASSSPTYSCSAGTYLPANKTTCTTCPAENYCPGVTNQTVKSYDQGLNKCPNPDTYKATSFPSSWHAYDGSAKVTSVEYVSWQSGAKSLGDCRITYRMKNNGGNFVAESVYYNTSSGKYDSNISTVNKYYTSVNAGYYLKTKFSDTYCSTSSNRMYYSDVDFCYSGNYCPGYSSMPLCSSGTYNTTYGLTSCPSGYTSEDDATKIGDCYINVSAGYYRTGTTGTTTTQCDYGTYRGSHWAYYGTTDSCTSCVTGASTTSKGSTSVSACQCDVGRGGNASTTSGTCTLCSTGSYKDDIGNYSCQSCDPGDYASTTGSQYCKTCPAGTYANKSDGATSCSLCASGYTSRTSNYPTSSSDCETCPNNNGGVYSWASRSFSATNGTLTGTNCSASTCSAGYYKSTTSGTSNSVAYENRCLACPSNSTTSNGNSSTTCTCNNYHSVDGTTSGATTTTSLAGCQGIAYLITLYSNYSSTDISVEQTMYQKYNTGWCGDTSCFVKALKATVPTRPGYTFTGYWTARSGGTQRIDAYGTLPSTTTFTSNTSLFAQWTQIRVTCTAGQYLMKGETECSPCPKGFYCPSSGTYTYDADNDQGITICPEGKYSDTYGATSCTNCPAGTYTAYKGAPQCTSCPIGTRSASGAATCTPCGDGMTTASDRTSTSTSCIKCPNNNAGVDSWGQVSLDPISNETSELCNALGCNAGYYWTNIASLGYTNTCTQCGPNSTTTDKNISFTCTCDANYTANGTASGATTSTSGCSPLTYTITLYSNTTSTSTAIAGYAYQRYNTGWYTSSTGNTVLSKATIPTRAGYKFTGYWSARSNGTRYIDENGNLPSNTTFTSNTTLYAQWELSEIECAPGYYISSGSTTCDKPCDVGYYCPGGPYDINSTSTSRTPCTNFGTGYTSEAGATAATQCYMNIAAGNYRNGATGTTLKVCPNWTYIGSHRAYWGTDDECTDCPDVTAGWSEAAGTGWESYTSCVQTRAATSISSYCVDGELSQTATASNTWGASKVTTKFQARAGAFVDGTTCSLCAAGTYTDSDGTQTECKTCSGGHYNTTAGSTGCDQCGVGYYCTGGTNRAKCPTGETTCGYGSCADEADDCGRILHAGGETIYLRSAKKTSPALHVQIGGKTYYGNMDTGTVMQKVGDPRQLLKINIGGKTYTVYNDNDVVRAVSPAN